MAEATLGLVNDALYALGERPISSLTEDSTQARAANAIHARSFRFILSKRNWSAATELQTIASDATWSSTNSARMPYRYAIPNKCVKVVRVFDSDEDQYYNWKRRGNYIYTDIASITLEYIRDITADNRIDPALGEVLSAYLAFKLAPRLTKEETVTQRVYQQYITALREAKTADAQQQGPHFYGPNQPVQGDYYEDHPDGWVDR